MRRFTIILCFFSRVAYGTYSTVQHETYAEHISRQSRSNLPTLQYDNVYRQFHKPGGFSAIRQPPVNPFVVHNKFGSLPYGKVKREPQIAYEDLMMPYTTPSSLKSEIDYALAKSAADARLESSKVKSDAALSKLKSLMHYRPPEMINENVGGYDGTSFYHMDDDDIRSSSRNMYDNWPYFYHSPYEYEYNKDVMDTQKAKDKRYLEDENIIPVSEIIENDIPQTYTPKYVFGVSDNPVSGDEPFFSFVLNDYYDKSSDDDPLTFKGIGLDWGKEFDHRTYLSDLDDKSKSVRIEYSTPIPQTVNHYQVYETQSESPTEIDTPSTSSRRVHNHIINHDKNEKGSMRKSMINNEFNNGMNQYNGMRDFLDSFANKFGSENFDKNVNYVRSTNQDKGENKTGFHRVYHKDEYQEDKNFFDNNRDSVKGSENINANVHGGGSEAYLRSQAAAAVGNQLKALSNTGYGNDENYENIHKAHDMYNKLENKLNNYRNVAKAAAASNSADYNDHYKN